MDNSAPYIQYCAVREKCMNELDPLKRLRDTDNCDEDLERVIDTILLYVEEPRPFTNKDPDAINFSCKTLQTMIACKDYICSKLSLSNKVHVDTEMKDELSKFENAMGISMNLEYACENSNIASITDPVWKYLYRISCIAEWSMDDARNELFIYRTHPHLSHLDTTTLHLPLKSLLNSVTDAAQLQSKEYTEEIKKRVNDIQTHLNKLREGYLPIDPSDNLFIESLDATIAYIEELMNRIK